MEGNAVRAPFVTVLLRFAGILSQFATPKLSADLLLF